MDQLQIFNQKTYKKSTLSLSEALAKILVSPATVLDWGGGRSSLIREAIRLISECKPRFFIWENVKGTFSSNDGQDFWAIIKAFTDIGGYRLEWQLLNTRWFLPQNRERIYLVGYIGNGSGRQVFPIGEDGNGNNEVRFSRKKTNRQEKSVQNTENRGRYTLFNKRPTMIADFMNDEGLRIRKDGNSPTLMTVKHSETEPSMMPPLALNKDALLGSNSLIRRLTPTECERLQGFPDGWTATGIIDGELVDISDTQRYKQLGNTVTVNVVQAVGKKILEAWK